MVIIRTQESSHGAEDAPVDVLYPRAGLGVPTELLLMDVTWGQSGLLTCLESNALVIWRTLVPSGLQQEGEEAPPGKAVLRTPALGGRWSCWPHVKRCQPWPKQG